MKLLYLDCGMGAAGDMLVQLPENSCQMMRVMLLPRSSMPPGSPVFTFLWIHP